MATAIGCGLREAELTEVRSEALGQREMLPSPEAVPFFAGQMAGQALRGLQAVKWTIGIVGFVGAIWLIPGNSADAVADWLVVQAVIDGGNPHGVLADLAIEQGFQLPEYTYPAPRLPGAILLQMPYALVPFEWMRYIGTTVALAPLVFAWWIIRPSWPAILLLIPAWRGLIEGNASGVVTLLVAIAVLRGSGPALGAATALRAWPWFLGVVFLVTGRRKAAFVSGLVFVGLNLAGLLLPGVSIAGTVSAMGAVHERFVVGAGGGLSPPLMASVLAAFLFIMLVRRHPEVARFGIVPALMLSPAVWTHYLTALAVPLAREGGTNHRVAGSVTTSHPKPEDSSDG